MKGFCVIVIAAVALASCRSTKPIKTAITKKDSVTRVVVPDGSSAADKRNDTIKRIQATLQNLEANHIAFTTFTAKVNIDYRGGDGKHYDVNATIRMLKDSAIWISVNALLGIEALRVLITKDSVKVLNKQDRTCSLRSVGYLQELTALPLNLAIVQDLLIGNPVFTDANVVSYSTDNSTISLLMLGPFFKNLLTLDNGNKTVLSSKLDDVDVARNRTANLTYGDYETKKGVLFPTRRRINVSEKTQLDIRLDFKQYDLGSEVSFPFSIPKNYKRD